MKNYPHLYTPVNKKASFNSLVQPQPHKKTNSNFATSHQYNKIASTRTFNQASTVNRNKKSYPRIGSRSIEQIHIDRSQQDNYDYHERRQALLQDPRNSLINKYSPSQNFALYSNNNLNHTTPLRNIDPDAQNQNDQLFQKSYNKIGQIKYNHHNKTIEQGMSQHSHQLNEVLQLIRQEKIKASETMKTLKKSADYYKKLSENIGKTFVDTQTNTEQQLVYYKQTKTEEQSTQTHTFDNNSENYHKNISSSLGNSTKRTDLTQTNQQQSKPDLKIDGKKIQIYSKLAIMLQDMNINSKQILPQDIHLQFEPKNYKTLTESEIIKIQKFFIKKLVEKIPK